jgi:hypothetical protein
MPERQMRMPSRVCSARRERSRKAGHEMNVDNDIDRPRDSSNGLEPFQSWEGKGALEAAGTRPRDEVDSNRERRLASSQQRAPGMVGLHPPQPDVYPSTFMFLRQ